MSYRLVVISARYRCANRWIILEIQRSIQIAARPVSASGAAISQCGDARRISIAELASSARRRRKARLLRASGM